MALFDVFKPPEIPDPVKPRDYTAEERAYYQDIVQEGDPLRPSRDRAAIDRLLTNVDYGIMGPTPASTLAFRQQAMEGLNEQVSDYMLQSSQLEQQRQMTAEQRFYQLHTQREMDLDEYEQLQTQTDAMREVMKKNYQSGLLRAGVNLVGTVAGIPGIGGLFESGPDLSGNPDRQAKVGLSGREKNPLDFGVDMGISPELGFGTDFANSQNQDDVLFNTFDVGLPEDYDPLDEMRTMGLYG